MKRTIVKMLTIEELHLLKLVCACNTNEELKEYKNMLHQVLLDLESKEYRMASMKTVNSMWSVFNHGIPI